MLSKLRKDMPSVMAAVATMLSQGVRKTGARAAKTRGSRPRSAIPSSWNAALLSVAE